MKHLLFVTVIALGAGLGLASQANAQGMPGGGTSAPQKPPPVKKMNGMCYPPDSIYYARITQDFVPFVAMIDCVKSGGKPVKR